VMILATAGGTRNLHVLGEIDHHAEDPQDHHR
jgi:hypothetical protein